MSSVSGSTTELPSHWDKDSLRELHKEYDPGDLHSIFDDIIFNYTRYALRDEDACGANKEVVSHLYALSLLREILCSIDHLKS